MDSFQNIILMAGWTAMLTTIAVMAAAILENKSSFAPVNAISHIFFGEKAYSVQSADPKYLLSGLVLNLGAMIGWSAVAEVGYRLLKLPAGNLAAVLPMSVAVTVLAYFTDFHLVPARFTPGFEHVLTKKALYSVYAVLAVGFVIGGLLRS